MCIVIDICALAPVFDKNCEEHSDFKHVLEWVMKRKGRWIYGGYDYKRELPQKYRKLVLELTKAGQAKELPEDEVNKKKLELEKIIKHRDFDDPHVIAIVIVSGGKIICSNDERAFPFFQMKMLYPKKFKVPKIYSGASSKSVLNDKNICRFCKIGK